MALFFYHLGLAARSLRRDPLITVIMLAALALGGGIWSVAVSQYVRFQGYEIDLVPTLFQVEIRRPQDHNSVFVDWHDNPYYEPTAIMARTQISYPELQRLASSRVPARRSAGIRAEVIVRAPGAAACMRVARFTDRDFFSMFERQFATGGPWERAFDEAASAASPGTPEPVVLGFALGQALFPRGHAVGQTIHVEGRPFRVAGVLDGYQPLNAPWQLLLTGGFEDALFLPLPHFDRLAVRPDQPIYRSPVGPERTALLASDALFVNLWVDLPTPDHERAYRADLDRLLGPGGYVLRSLSAWRQEFPMPRSQIAFFAFLGFIVLLGSAFNVARWLLTKGLSRSAELGVFRALGARRSSLFWRIMAEAALLAAPAALLAPIAAMPLVWLFNRHVRVVDMPLEVGRLSVLVTVLPAFVAWIVGGIYPAWRIARTPPTLYLGGL